MFARAGSPFVDVVKAALDEARRRGNRRLGTEHLLLGLLHDPGSAEAIGIDLDTARAAMDTLDQDALRAIGLPVGELTTVSPRRHPPVTLAALTSSARTVLDRAVATTTVKTRRTAPTHMLLELLDRARPDPVTELIDRLAIDRDAVRAKLRPQDPRPR